MGLLDISDGSAMIYVIANDIVIVLLSEQSVL